jgi:hypothetical protein
VIRVGVVFVEPDVNESVVEGLVIDPQKEELSQLKVGLELEVDNLEWGRAWNERLWFGCDRLGERVHLALTITHMVFIDR